MTAMVNSNVKPVLVLGGTGPAGICLLRELIHRNYPTIVFARNPSKLPNDVSSNSLLEVCLNMFELCTIAGFSIKPRSQIPYTVPCLLTNTYRLFKGR